MDDLVSSACVEDEEKLEVGRFATSQDTTKGRLLNRRRPLVVLG